MIRDVAQFFLGTLASGILLLLQGLLVAKVLGPTHYGVWNILMVVLTYTSYAHLGLLHGLNKELPLWRGRGEASQAKKLRDVAFWCTCIIALGVGAFLLAGSWIRSSHLSPEVLRGVRLLAAIAALQQLYLFLVNLLRAERRFVLLSFATALLPLASLLLILLFFNMLSDKLMAAVTGLLLAYLLLNTFILSASGYRFQFLLHLKYIKTLFLIGFPIIFINIGYIFLVSLDRWMLAGLATPTDIGYYGIALTIANVLLASGSVVGFVLYPRMLEKFGQTGEPGQSEALVYPPLKATSYVMVVVCALTIFFAPLLIHYWLPAYEPALPVVPLLTLGVYFLTLQTIAGNYLISIDKQRLILYLQMGALPLMMALDYAFLKGGGGIRGVAIATSLVYFLYGTAVITLALHQLHPAPKALLRRIAALYLPFLASLPVIFLLRRIIPLPRISLWDDALVVGIQMGSFLLLASPLLWHLVKVTGAGNLLNKGARATTQGDSNAK